MITIKKRLSSSQIIILGFAGAILFGSILLTLPFSTRDGQSGRTNTDLLGSLRESRKYGTAAAGKDNGWLRRYL